MTSAIKKMCPVYIFSILLLVLMTSSSSESFDDTQCQLSTCTQLDECYSIKEMLERCHHVIHTMILKSLQKQICGFHEDQPKICCPILEDLKTNAMKSINPSTEAIFADIECRSSFECISILDCSPFLYLMEVQKPLTKSMVTMIKSIQCGFEDGSPKICCQLPLKVPNLDVEDINSELDTKAIILSDSSTVAQPISKNSNKQKSFFSKMLREQVFNNLFDLTDFDMFRKKRNFDLNSPDIEIR